MTRYETERQFFDRLAAETIVQPLSQPALERYARPRHPHLFAKEFMFSLLGDARGLRVLEIGCGQGVTALQLAYCGAQVTGIDLSEGSIRVARQRAALQGLNATFKVANIETDDLGQGCFDVVWCDLILHHVVPSLDTVLQRVTRALAPGGLFIAREPLAYAGWLKTLRRLTPVAEEATPDEQPLRPNDLAVLERHLGPLHYRHFRLFARVDKLTPNLSVIGLAARLDNLLFHLPGMRCLAGNAVLWGRKRTAAGVDTPG